MNLPLFCRDTYAHARAHKVWAAAFFLTLLIPFMIIFARVGFEICGGLIGLMFLWHSVRTRTWGWLRDPFSILCGVAWVWMVLVVQPLAVSPSAQWGDVLAWIRFPLLFAALRFWVLAVPAARTTLAAMLVVLVVLVMVDTLWQFYTGVSLSGNPRTVHGRLTGPFEHPKVGMVIAKLALVALAVCVAAAAGARRWLVGGVLLWAMVVLTVLLCGDRSVFLMAVMATAVIALPIMRREKRLRMPMMIAACASVVGLWALYQTSPWVQLRANQGYETITNYAQSDYGVIAISAYDMGREYWLHGVGVRGYKAMAPDLYYKGEKFRSLHPHHAFLEMFAEAGVVGLLLLVAMVTLLARNALQYLRVSHGSVALVPAVALGVLVQHFFPLVGMQSFFGNWSAMVLWFCLAVIFSAIPSNVRSH